MMRRGTTLVILAAIFLSTPMLIAQATRAADQIEVVTRVYDLRDLMMNIGDYPFTGRIGAPSDKEVVIVNSNNPESQPQTRPADPAIAARISRVEQLVKLIQETVDTDSWRDNGGTVGSIRELSGLLVVTQSESAHKQIETLLGQLREDHLRTVRVQADWIVLTSEQARSLLPAEQKSEGKVSARLLDPAALAKLSDSAARFHAELSCFSGQTVSISSGRTHTAIVDQEPVVAQEAAALNPSVKHVQVGAMLELTPTLETSLDTAVVDVRSQVADWAEPTQTEVATRRTTTSPNGARLGGESPAVVDRLNLLSQEFRTTARLPVGRPVLIGGMSAEPSQTEPPSAQLYLILQLTAGK